MRIEWQVRTPLACGSPARVHGNLRPRLGGLPKNSPDTLRQAHGEWKSIGDTKTGPLRGADPERIGAGVSPEAPEWSAMHLERRDDVFVLTLDDGDNRLHRRFLDDMNRALDEVERSEGPAALVTTGQGKFYSNGLDLDWLGGQSAADSGRFLDDLDRLFARVLTFPAATAAAINGHAFAAGLMLALAHDFRVMRADRGYACLPEIDLGVPLRPGMTATIQARLPQRIAHEAIVTGRRYGGADAEQRGIVDAAVAEADVLSRAIAMVAPLAGKDRATMSALKRGLYVQALGILERPR